MTDRCEQARAVFLAAIMVISMVAMGSVFVGSAVADEDEETLFVDDDFDEPGENEFTTIQAAVDAANSGDTVVVAEGTYDEQVTIDVDGLMLEGPNAGTAGDEERDLEATITDGVLWTNQDDITVDGFEVEREIGNGNGVFELGSGGDARIGDNAVIKNNVIIADPDEEDRGNLAGVLFEGDLDDELFVENNLITQEDGEDPSVDVVNAVAHFESEIGTLEVTDNTIETQSAVSLGGGSSDITAEIKDNEFTDSFEAFPAVQIAESDEIDVDIDDNTFDSVVAGIRVGEGVDVDGADSVSITNNNFIDDDTAWFIEDQSGTLDLQSIVSQQQNTFDPDAVKQDDQIVSETSVDVVNVDQQTGFDEIQSAVNAAEDGDTIEVGPGTYDELVTIEGVSVTLEGPNAGVPGFDDQNRTDEATITEGISFDSGSGDVAPFSGTTIDGLEFEGTENAIVTDGSPDSVEEITVTNNRFIDIKGNALRTQGSPDTTELTVSDNLVDGLDEDAAFMLNTFDGVVQNNVIDGGEPGSEPVHPGPRGIQVDGTTGTADVSENTIENVGVWGIQVAAVEGETDGVEIENNDISDAYAALSLRDDLGDVTASRNNLTDSGFGVLVRDSAEGNFEKVAVSNNNVVGNEVGAEVEDEAGEDVGLDATSNWWGATDGPSGEGDGHGADVSENVEYEPYLTVDSGEVNVEADFVGIVSDESDEISITASDVQIEGDLGPATGTFVFEIAGETYDVEMTDGEIDSEFDPEKIDPDAETGDANVSVVVSEDKDAVVDTVGLVHEVEGLDEGWNPVSVPQPAFIQAEGVNEDELVTFDPEEGYVPADQIEEHEAYHNGLYVWGEESDARMGYDFLTEEDYSEHGEIEGPQGTATISNGWNLVSSNYNISANDGQQLDDDLANVQTVSSSDHLNVWYDGTLDTNPDDRTVEEFDTYWVYKGSQIQDQPRAIDGFAYDPEQRDEMLNG